MIIIGVAVASWLMWPLYQVVRVYAVAEDIMWCSWARHLTLKWVPANLMLFLLGRGERW